ncbi:MAG: AMP-binding protein [Dinoroseobacter sp.]|nr:AMP-binding protein [Dinoroseobacter sp.]
MHLGEATSRAAKLFGETPALIFQDQSFSFSELNDMVERVAAGLSTAGIAKGDVVTLYAGNSWQWIVCYYAIARAGAVINPINTMLTPSEISYVVEDCKSNAIITSEDKLDGAKAVLDKVRLAVVISNQAPDGVITFDSLLNSSAELLVPIDVPNDSLSTICYTSGTTGYPKGAMQSHRAVITNAAMTAQMQMRGRNDVIVSALPCPHVYANVVMHSMMFYGATLVLHDRFEPAAMLADIEKYQATLIDGVPTMYMFMLNDPTLATTDFSSLKRAYVGGQTMPVATMERVEKAFGVPLVELWGMTEIAGLGSTHPAYGQNRHGSVGVALPYCELRVADSEDPETILPYGERGELQVRGPITMQGYFGDEEKTKATLLPSGWLRTGDIAMMDEDGCVFIVDRLKDMILTGGYNVYPAEIERVLALHPDVALAAVGKCDDKLKGEIAIAYVVLKQGVKGDADVLMALCQDNLAAYKCPRKIRFVADVPKTSTGKIMRRELHKLN